MRAIKKRIVLHGIVCAVLVSISLSASAGYEDAVEAYKKGDYAYALKELRPLAEQGDARAQNYLGIMYKLGQGVPQDYAEALKWFHKAAEQGNAAAQGNLGNMHYNGEGVSKDYAEAAQWYRKAAEGGHAIAQYILGMMYVSGKGVPQDYAEAAKWLRKSAEQGNDSAINKLALLYASGKGVPKDRVLAYALSNYMMIKNKKDNSSSYDILNRPLIPVTDDELREAEALTRELVKPGNTTKALKAYLEKTGKTKELASESVPRFKSNREYVDFLINQEEENAKLACERIKNDTAWKKFAEILNERQTFFEKLTDEEYANISKDDSSYQVTIEAVKISRKLYREEMNKKKDGSDEEVLARTRMMRVLRKCGEDLFNSGLLPITYYYYYYYTATGSRRSKDSALSELRSEISRYASSLEHEDNDLKESANLYTKPNISVYSDIPDDRDMGSVYFPYHDLIKNGDKLFAESFDFQAFRKIHADSLAKLNQNLIKARQKIAAEKSRKEKQELETLARTKVRADRIEKIKSGNIHVAQSCEEVAEALIPKNELVLSLISIDTDNVYLNPTKKLYAVSRPLVDTRGNSMIALRDLRGWPTSENPPFLAHVLMPTSKTVWIKKDQIRIGSFVYYVGRYVANGKITNEIGTKNVRVMELVCIEPAFK